MGEVRWMRVYFNVRCLWLLFLLCPVIFLPQIYNAIDKDYGGVGVIVGGNNLGQQQWRCLQVSSNHIHPSRRLLTQSRPEPLYWYQSKSSLDLSDFPHPSSS